MKEMKFTGERLVPSLVNAHGVTEHLHRYALALELVKNKTVLDIASGEGYGSNLLSKYASFVYGVDIDKDSIEHAQQKYVSEGQSNLEFKIGSATSIPLKDDSIDVVISFETIEHLDEHDKMMKEIKRVLKSDGKLLISSPEKSIYSERDPNNPFHIKELNIEEFKELIETYFKNFFLFEQRFIAGSLVTGVNNSSFKTYYGNYKEINNGFKTGKIPFYNKPYFNLAICSDEEIPQTIFASFFDGANVLINENKQWAEKYNKFKNSLEYKIGNRILKKIPVLKKLLS